MFTGDKCRGIVHSAGGFMASFGQEQLEIETPHLLLLPERKKMKNECG
jgi:hypothetical protein